MAESRIELAYQRAHQILLDGGYAPPIPIDRIVRDYGATVQYRQLEDTISGVIAVTGGLPTIVVNSRHSHQRQRFTIAHELGHWLLHGGTSTAFVDGAYDSGSFRDKTSKEGTDPQEIEANAFAAELLMPEAIVRLRVSPQRVADMDDVAIRRLAAQFDVSPQALTVRLTRLGLI